MSDRTLGKARGLNSIADPADFKGSRGRRRERKAADTPPPPKPEDRADSGQDYESPEGQTAEVIDLVDAQQSSASIGAREVQGSPDPLVSGPEGASVGRHAAPANPPTPHRAVVPGLQRKRRELSIPVPVAEALAATGINPADIVMSAYRRHSDAIFAGGGGRMLSRGRQRLRLSISDGEFDKLTRLGEARGWNRSETVAVLLAMELLAPVEKSVAD